MLASHQPDCSAYGIQMHHSHTVDGCAAAALQIADTGVSALLWTMSAVFIPRGEPGIHVELICMESEVCHQNNSRFSKVA